MITLGENFLTMPLFIIIDIYAYENILCEDKYYFYATKNCKHLFVLNSGIFIKPQLKMPYKRYSSTDTHTFVKCKLTK